MEDYFWQRFQLPFTQLLNVDVIAQHLCQVKLLTFSELERLRHPNFQSENWRIITLTSILSKKGPDAIQQFLDCLMSEQTHRGHGELLADIAAELDSLPERVRRLIASQVQQKRLAQSEGQGRVKTSLVCNPENCGDPDVEVEHASLGQNSSSRGINVKTERRSVLDCTSLSNGDSGSFSQETASGLGKRSSQPVCGPTRKRRRYSPCSHVRFHGDGAEQLSELSASEFASQYTTESFRPCDGHYHSILKEHQLSFVKYISLEALIPHLNRQHILTFEEQDKLANQEQEEASRIRELLDIVESKGADCYVKFIRAIFEEKTHDGHMTLSAEVQRNFPNDAQLDGSMRPPPLHVSRTCGDISALQEYRDYLFNHYKRELPIMTKWSPRSTTTYINLASIKKEKINKTEANTFTKATLHGNLEDILKVKESVQIEQIAAPLPDGSQPKCVVVEGAPGVGKTTFAWELSKRWGQGRILRNYNCVVLLRLREKRVQKAKSLFDLFFYTNDVVRKSVVRTFETNHNGRGLLLILEGFDECPGKRRNEESFIGQLILGDVLPGATILITTRPSASESLFDLCEQRVDQHIEILGFTNENIDSYIDSVIHDPSLRTEFRGYLDCYPHIQTALYVPLHCAIVVEVYLNSRRDCSNCSMIPKTVTDLYSSLAQSLLLRYLKDLTGRNWKIQRLNDLRDKHEVYGQLCALGKMAYHGLCHDKVIFTTLPEGVDHHGLGLMQCAPELYIDEGTKHSYNFIHLTLQEYLAAFYLSLQSKEEWIKAFESKRNKCPRMKVMLRFLAGLTGLKGIPKRVLRRLLFLPGQGTRRETTLDGLHWLFEAQYHRTGLASVLGRRNIELNCTWTTPSAFDCFVLGYCIAHSKCGWELTMTECDIGDEGLEILAKGIGSEPTGCIACIRARGNGITIEGMRHLLGVPQQVFRKLTEIELGNNKVDGETCNLLAECVAQKYMPKLETISLSGNPLGHGGAVQLLQAMRSSLSKCALLSLFSTSVGLEDSRALAELLHSPMAFDTIYIGGNKLNSESAYLLLEAVRNHQTLKHLFIAGAALSPPQLASVLKDNETLVELDIRYCSIGSAGACELAEALKENTTLEELYIDGNPIGDAGAEAIAGMLGVNTNLQTLWINETVGNLGLHRIVDSLKGNSSLQQLILNLVDSYKVLTLRKEVEKDQSFQGRVKFMNDVD